MLVIEHHVPLVLRVCDHVYVLNFGRLLAQGTPQEVQQHPEVVAAYLGGEAPEALAATEEPEQDAAAESGMEAAAPAPAPRARKAPAKKAPAKKASARKAPAKRRGDES
jgi:branched-chain amino acid transport system ATP-binding protein